MTVLSIDPGRGEKASIGYCLFTDEGYEMARGSMTWGDLVRRYRLAFGGVLYLDLYPLSRVVCEDFVNDPRVKRGGQTNGASEVIGAVEFLANQADVPFIRRDRSTLTAAKLHAGYTQTLKHLPHADAAYVHGYSDFVMRGLCPALGVAGDMLESG